MPISSSGGNFYALRDFDWKLLVGVSSSAVCSQLDSPVVRLVLHLKFDENSDDLVTKVFEFSPVELKIFLTKLEEIQKNVN